MIIPIKKDEHHKEQINAMLLACGFNDMSGLQDR
jgi:hypothetical protein